MLCGAIDLSVISYEMRSCRTVRMAFTKPFIPLKHRLCAFTEQTMAYKSHSQNMTSDLCDVPDMLSCSMIKPLERAFSTVSWYVFSPIICKNTYCRSILYNQTASEFALQLNDTVIIAVHSMCL